MVIYIALTDALFEMAFLLTPLWCFFLRKKKKKKNVIAFSFRLFPATPLFEFGRLIFLKFHTATYQHRQTYGPKIFKNHAFVNRNCSVGGSVGTCCCRSSKPPSVCLPPALLALGAATDEYNVQKQRGTNAIPNRNDGNRSFSKRHQHQHRHRPHTHTHNLHSDQDDVCDQKKYPTRAMQSNRQ